MAPDATRLTAQGREQARLAGEVAARLSREALLQRREALHARVRGDGALPHHAVDMQVLARALGEDVRDWPESGLLPGASRSWLLRSADSAADELSRLDRSLVAADVQGLSARDLRVLRATVEARRGRPFAGLLGRHFSRTTWYRPDPEYSRRVLTGADWDNLGRLDAWSAQRESSSPDLGPQDQWGPEAGWYYGS